MFDNNVSFRGGRRAPDADLYSKWYNYVIRILRGVVSYMYHAGACVVQETVYKYYYVNI